MTNAAHHQSRFRLNSYILEYCIRVPFSDRYCLENSSPELQLVSENALEVYINATLQLTVIAELANQSTPGH
ncbi:hypothetical protein OUZ56_000285 [Daphnia magna]|uniref:Uncharacterized protein n=1 Tax=Daphnia magna TaxID=35525 RepID=A0ABQ9ZZ76_9CRUS|nr:hypothetical protein OUZ56_000285 [Daphnia magna]